jgi:hypothetical protein
MIYEHEDSGNRRTRRKTYFNITFSTTWTDLGANPGFRGEKRLYL